MDRVNAHELLKEVNQQLAVNVSFLTSQYFVVHFVSGPWVVVVFVQIKK